MSYHASFRKHSDNVMRTIALVTQKGGSGKSTIATNLAVEACAGGKKKVLLIDCDQQATAERWYQVRPEEYEQPQLVRVKESEVVKAHELAQRNGFDFVIIDTAGRDLPSIKLALSVADVCLVPCAPSGADIQAVVSTYATLTEQNKAFAFVISQAFATGARNKETEAILEKMGKVAPLCIVRRAVYQDAIAKGVSVGELEPHSKAAEEMHSLWDWTHNFLKKVG